MNMPARLRRQSRSRRTHGPKPRQQTKRIFLRACRYPTGWRGAFAEDRPSSRDDPSPKQTTFAREQAEHKAKLAVREAKTNTTGKKPGGRPPAPPVGVLPADQINLTGEEARIIPAVGGGFKQYYLQRAEWRRAACW
jgi:hypothetical protein